MTGYKLSDTRFLVPVPDYTGGRMADGWQEIGPDHPDFERWKRFVEPLPANHPMAPKNKRQSR